MKSLIAILAAGLAFGLAGVVWFAFFSGPKTEEVYVADIEPILEKHCYDCHGFGEDKGDFAMDSHKSFEKLEGDRHHWLRVWENLRSDIMPPAKKARLSESEREKLMAWIQLEIFGLRIDKPDPGRVTVRRLNRLEYRWTINDLFGINLDVEDLLPPDDTGYGFDNIGDVLTTSPMLMDKYVKSSRLIVNELAKKANPQEPNWRYPSSIPSDATKRRAFLKSFLAEFAERAYRAPVDQQSLDRLVGLAKKVDGQEGKNLRDGFERSMEAVLISPKFLFRGDVQPKEGKAGQSLPIDDFALASRLSYFFWKGPPDRSLFKLAKSGNLRSQLEEQVNRMLADPKAERFVADFVGQWLQIRSLMAREIHSEVVLGVTVPEAGKLFPNSVKRAMKAETEQFFGWVLQNDRDAIELLSADYTFLNEPLAKFYDVPGVKGNEMRRVSLKSDSPRGGLLSQGSILIATSNPNRTSPVKRGIFVLENLLATPAPPAVDNIPALEEVKKNSEKSMTVRDQLEKHRESKQCASCHKRMDPIGLGLENFNAIGKWRTREEATKRAIKPEGKLITGEEFSTVQELKNILVTTKQDDFHRALAEKLLTYGLGRGIEIYDAPTIDQIVNDMNQGEPTLRRMVHLIVSSRPFLYRRKEKS